MRTKMLVLAPLGVLLAGLALPAWAATTWSFTCTVNCGTSTGTAGNTRTATANNVTLTARAFADTGSSITGGRALQTAYLSWWNDAQGNAPPTGGLGVTNQARCTTSGCSGDFNEGTSPEHGIDNNQRWDAVMFTFGDTGNPSKPLDYGYNLSEIGLSWYSNDADISVFAYQPGQIGGADYTNPAAPNLANGTTTYAGSTNGLIAKGWQLVGNYADLQARPNMTAQLNTNLVSSYWLVMAYNSAFSGGGCNLAGGGSSVSPGCTNGSTSHYDYMKLRLVGGNTPSNGASEPGSIALFGTVLAGVTWARRRKAVK